MAKRKVGYDPLNMEVVVSFAEARWGFPFGVFAIEDAGPGKLYKVYESEGGPEHFVLVNDAYEVVEKFCTALTSQEQRNE